MTMPHNEQTKPSGGPTQRSTSVGATLRGARESRQLSIEHLASELRIEPRHLHALESDRFDTIGVPVFTKGYLKQYGLRLGLDTSDLLRRYQEQVEDDEVHLVARRPIQMPDARPFGFWLLALLGLALIGALVVFFVLGRTGMPIGFMESFGAAGPPAGVGVAVPSANRTATEGRIATGPTEGTRSGAAASVATAINPDSGAGTPGEMLRGGDREAPATAAPESGDSSPAGNESASAIADAGAGMAAVTESPAMVVPDDAALPAAAQSARIELSFAAECWVDAIDATGARKYYGLGRGGDRAEFDAVLPLDILVGDAGAVTLSVNGEPFPVPQPRRGNRARFSVHPVEQL
jgi:cytoskeleton protein RodZ